MKLEVVWRCDDEPQHARIENVDLDSDYGGSNWSDAYVSIGGYFGSHGPHVFASAPDLLKALVEAKTHLEQAKEITGLGFPATMCVIDAAIRKARGEE